jgi:hypothetical protein
MTTFRPLHCALALAVSGDLALADKLLRDYRLDPRDPDPLETPSVLASVAADWMRMTGDLIAVEPSPIDMGTAGRILGPRDEVVMLGHERRARLSFKDKNGNDPEARSLRRFASEILLPELSLQVANICSHIGNGSIPARATPVRGSEIRHARTLEPDNITSTMTLWNDGVLYQQCPPPGCSIPGYTSVLLRWADVLKLYAPASLASSKRMKSSSSSQRGRKAGDGMYDDELTLRQMRELLSSKEARNPSHAAELVAGNAEGRGTPESTCKRLVRKYKAWTEAGFDDAHFKSF